MDNLNLSQSKLVYKNKDLLMKKFDTSNSIINKNSINYHSYNPSNETKATSTVNYHSSVLKNEQPNGIQLGPIKKQLSQVNILERIRTKKETSPNKSRRESPLSVSILKQGNLKRLTDAELKSKHDHYLNLATNLEEKFNALLGFHLTNVQNNQDQNKSNKLLKNTDISYSLGILCEADKEMKEVKSKNQDKYISIYDKDQKKKVQILNLSQLLKNKSGNSVSKQKRVKSKSYHFKDTFFYKQMEASRELSHSLQFSIDKELVKNLDYMELLNQIKKQAKYGEDKEITIDDFNKELMNIHSKSRSLNNSESISKNITKRTNGNMETKYELTEVKEETADDFVPPKLKFSKYDDLNKSIDSADLKPTRDNKNSCEGRLITGRLKSQDSKLSGIESKKSSTNINTRFINYLANDVNDQQFLNSKTKDLLYNKGPESKRSTVLNSFTKNALMVDNNTSKTNTEIIESRRPSDFSYINDKIRNSISPANPNTRQKRKGSFVFPVIHNKNDDELMNKINYYKSYRTNVNNEVVNSPSFNKVGYYTQGQKETISTLNQLKSYEESQKMRRK